MLKHCGGKNSLRRFVFFFFPIVGWALASCPHMVVYCIKFVLRGESPRDYVDLLRSLAFPPSVSISDMPQHLAAHANRTVSNFFRPHVGRLFAPSEANINAAKEGRLMRHLHWVKGMNVPKASPCATETKGDEIHPVTGVSDRYSLNDRFHERNSSCPPDLLRRVSLVPEITAVVNTEVEEQLHSVINRSNYSFNTMLPGNHLFIMHLKMHMNNVRINEAYILRLEKATRVHTGPSRCLQCHANGMLRLQTISKKWLGFNNSGFTENVPSDTSDRTPCHIHGAGNTEKPENLSMEKDQQKVQELRCMLVT